MKIKWIAAKRMVAGEKDTKKLRNCHLLYIDDLLVAEAWKSDNKELKWCAIGFAGEENVFSITNHPTLKSIKEEAEVMAKSTVERNATESIVRENKQITISISELSAYISKCTGHRVKSISQCIVGPQHEPKRISVFFGDVLTIVADIE